MQVETATNLLSLISTADQSVMEDRLLPEHGSGATAAHCIRHALVSDIPPERNLASFVTTEMDETADRLAWETLDRNLINSAEYPALEAMHQAVIRIVADLFHAELPEVCRPASTGLLGTTTVGSSEAVMLALLAHKWRWRQQRPNTLRRSGLDRPYLIIGTHTHACFAKFARYFDVGVKWIPLLPGQYAITAEQVRAILETPIIDDEQVMHECGVAPDEVIGQRVGELVMAVGCVVGTTYTGHIDDVAGIDRVLSDGGWDIPIHVDAASGGFVFPFAADDGEHPAPIWDFRLSHVRSINASNHKYGLVYPGLGTLVFRNTAVVPEELLVDVDYLSGTMRNFSLNFSRPASGVVLQYYSFLRLGRAGYRRVIQGCLAHARELGLRIRHSAVLQPLIEIVSAGEHLPLVVLKRAACAPFTLAELAEALRARGWMVPVYHLPADNEDVEVMRMVIRSHVDQPLIATLAADLEEAVRDLLARRSASAPEAGLATFRLIAA